MVRTPAVQEERLSISFRAPLAELIGTFVFVFIGAGAVCTEAYTRGGVGLPGIALAFGLTLAIMISALGSISGGHLNPAVTIAFLVTRRVTVPQAISYVVAQIVGG